MKSEITAEVGKATPPAAIVAYGHMSGWTLNEWVLVATLVYICMQGAYLLWKWWREWRKG